MFAICEHVVVHVITKRRLREFWVKHPAAESPLTAWFKITSNAEWTNLADLHRDFPSADYVAPWTVFDIGGNKYRLIVKVEYRFRKVFIAYVFTHAEYDRWKA